MLAIKKELLFIFIVLAALLIPAVSFAQSSSSGNISPSDNSGNVAPSGSSGNSIVILKNPLNNITGFCGFIKQLFLSAGALGVPIAVLFLVYAGFLFVWARGRPEALTKAKNNLFYTLFGIAIFFAAWMLALAIAATLAQFGVNIAGDCR